MPVNCPHCSKEVADVIPQSEFNRRLKEKTDQADGLKAELDAAAPKAKGYDSVKTELDQARTELTGIRTKYTQYEALVSRGYTDPRVAASLNAIHGAEMAGKVDKDRVDLATWLDGEGKTHPVVAALPRGGTPAPGGDPPAGGAPATGGQPAPGGAPPAGGAPAAGGAPPNPPPSNNAGAGGGAPGGGGMTPAQLSAYFNGAEYKALPRDQQRAKLAELTGKYNQPAAGGQQVAT